MMPSCSVPLIPGEAAVSAVEKTYFSTILVLQVKFSFMKHERFPFKNDTSGSVGDCLISVMFSRLQQKIM